MNTTTIRRPVPPPSAVIDALATIATRLESLAARRFGAACETPLTWHPEPCVR
jgi:hypothetical protein